MNRPTMAQYDGWRASPAGQWFFGVYLQEVANQTAEDNGRSVGNRGSTLHDDYMILAKQAGSVDGIEFAINHDPFEDERKETESEDKGDRQEPANPHQL